MIDMQTFLSKFKGVKQVRGGYMVQCPCHDDKTASLSIGMGDKGIVLHCFSDCKTDDILRKVGVTWRDLCTDEVQREWQTAHPAGAVKTQQKAQKSTKPAAEITTKPPKKILADLNRLKIGGTYAQRTHRRKPSRRCMSTPMPTARRCCACTGRTRSRSRRFTATAGSGFGATAGDTMCCITCRKWSKRCKTAKKC